MGGNDSQRSARHLRLLGGILARFRLGLEPHAERRPFQLRPLALDVQAQVLGDEDLVLARLLRGGEPLPDRGGRSRRRRRGRGGSGHGLRRRIGARVGRPWHLSLRRPAGGNGFAAPLRRSRCGNQALRSGLGRHGGDGGARGGWDSRRWRSLRSGDDTWRRDTCCWRRDACRWRRGRCDRCGDRCCCDSRPGGVLALARHHHRRGNRNDDNTGDRSPEKLAGAALLRCTW